MASRRAGLTVPTTSRPSVDRCRREHASVRIVGAAAFLLLAVALCVRAMLNEDRSILVSQLLMRPEFRSSAGLMARHVCHLVAAGGIGLAVLWIALSRRSWRVGGLEVGAFVLACGALLSVPVASDKRLALNSGIDTILPLIAAAALYQLLARSAVRRRALLAGLVAIAAANGWKATAQRYWEYAQSRQKYEQNKVTFWSQQGVRLDDPEVAAFETAQKTARPMGFIRGANVLSSFLLLGLAVTVAAFVARGWPWIAAATLGLLVVWQLVVLFWTRTAGSVLGLLAAIAVGAAGLWLRDRPRRLAILLASGLVLLQTTLVVLAMCPPDLHRALLSYRGAGDKIRTLGARLCYWRGAIQLFVAHPMTGIGPSQFGKHYLAVRPAHSDERPADAHNWLLNAAAEWGILGVLGVLIAVGGSGWSIVRAAARPPDEADRPARAALLPAMLVVLGCWLIVVCDLPRSLWANILPYPLAISLAVAAVVSLCRLCSRTGQLVLLAGLVGFFVHCADEITPTVPGVMWPFWAIVALAMAWNGHPPATSIAQTPAWRCVTWAGPVLAAAAALAVVTLTVRPVRAVRLMDQARQAALGPKREQAVQLLRAAAEADPLDPLPPKAAALLRYRLGQIDTARALMHFRDCVALSLAAVQRNPFDYHSWWWLGLANMYLATETGNYALVEEAMRDMRRALELNPQWPAGWLELARMAAVQDDTQPDRPDLLETALVGLDKAVTLAKGQVYGDVSKLSEREFAEIAQMRQDLQRRLAKLAGTSTRPFAK
jgi:tetratricopeptide (TPR) repeat protein